MTVRGVLPCFHHECDAPGVYGFTWPGFFMDQPEDRRGKWIWACGKHRREADRRWAREIEGGSEGADDTASEPDHSAQAKESAMATGQLDLFMDGSQ